MSNQPQEVDVLAELIETAKEWLRDVLPHEWALAWVPASE